MEKPFTVILGGVLSFMLLSIYTISVVWIVLDVIRAGNNAESATVLSDGMVYVVTTIGGLVSALVVAKLAITEPGENPAIVKLAVDNSGMQPRFVTVLAILYLSVWLFVGLSALVVGVMIYPDLNQSLSDIGTTWLGLAVAAGYAYFGIDPK